MKICEKNKKELTRSEVRLICENCGTTTVEGESEIITDCPNCNSRSERFYVYKLESMTEEQKIELVREVELEVVKEGDTYRVKDMLPANLGDIESEWFDTVDEIIDRIDYYFYDYGMILE